MLVGNASAGCGADRVLSRQVVYIRAEIGRQVRYSGISEEICPVVGSYQSKTIRHVTRVLIPFNQHKISTAIPARRFLPCSRFRYSWYTMVYLTHIGKVGRAVVT